ncbi:MAG: hypothetical protein AAF386_00360 [Pseudomonadota bacterium]
MKDGPMITFDGSPFLRLGADHSDFPWHKFKVAQVLGRQDVLDELARLAALIPVDEEDLDWSTYETAAEASFAKPFSDTAYGFVRDGRPASPVIGMMYWPDDTLIAFR